MQNKKSDIELSQKSVDSDDALSPEIPSTFYFLALSELSLSKIWLSPEEDEAWRDL